MPVQKIGVDKVVTMLFRRTIITMTTVVQTTNLTKYYGKERGIEDINLEVAEGEIFGFIGPNGAGKSTTIRTLLGLLKPTSGSATIFGKNIETDGPVIRADIGYLPSEVFYYDRMKVIDLLRYSASFYDLPKVTMEKRMRELATLLDLDLDKKIDDLSYGNKKKVGIVQGLQHSPKLIILDEPTGGLDPLMQQTFFELLRAENKRGATVLFSSHILSEVQKMCDRVAIIREGRIIETQSIAELRKSRYLRCKLELAQANHAKTFHIEGASNLTHHDSHVSFLYKGDINALMARLASETLASVSLEEPDLEEIFMHFYTKEG